MAHKVLINGTAYGIKGGKTLVGGTGYSIKKGRTLVGGTGYNVNFSTPLGSLAIGSVVKLTFRGAAQNFIVCHIGKPSSMYDDSFTDGVTLLMQDIYENRAWNSYSNNDYAASGIHSYLNGTFLGYFDSGIQSRIKQVKIPYVKGTGNGPVYSGSSGLSTKIFLLSGRETGNTRNYSPNDGACLSYFSGSSSALIGTLNGRSSDWWLRSPYTDFILNAWCVTSSGSFTKYSCESSYGVRPALVLPSTTEVDSSMFIS